MSIAGSLRRCASSLRLDSLWSVTQFRDRDISAYAERAVIEDVRRGVAAMAGLSVVLQSLAGLLHVQLGAGSESVYVYALIAALGLHVMFATRTQSSLRALYALGVTLLVVTSAALVLLAHRVGTVNGALLASVVLLFMVIPLVPWGLKQCLTAMALIYATFTFSTVGVAGRFTADSLLTMQFLMLAAALTTMAIVARNLIVRRDDIEARFTLEQAHREMHLLSQQDPLTGAWNRRFLESSFESIVADFMRARQDVHFALLDVDDFKGTNDRYGHQHGDAVLERLVHVLRAHFGDAGYVVRLGGDEFAVLYRSAARVSERSGPLSSALEELRAGSPTAAPPFVPIHASVGMVAISRDAPASLDAIYRRADEALYAEKQRRRREAAPERLEQLLGSI
jgi:diguanylate cyclase (GGDEF)-like protein